MRPEPMENRRGQRSAAGLMVACTWPLGRELGFGAKVFRLSRVLELYREKESLPAGDLWQIQICASRTCGKSKRATCWKPTKCGEVWWNAARAPGGELGLA